MTMDAAVPLLAGRRPATFLARRPTGATAAPNATLVARVALSADVVRLRVLPDGGVPAFRPGQYVALAVADGPGAPGGRLVQRPYSIASPSGDDAFEFLVRLVPDGALTPRLWRLRAGDRLIVGQPKGLFTLDDADPRRPVLIASGTGIAPLRSILAARLATDMGGHSAPIVLHGVAHARDLAYREEFECLHRSGRIVYAPTVSRPQDPANARWYGRTGRVGRHLPGLLDELRVEPRRAVALLCGNAAMTGSAGAALRDWGLPDDAIRVEAWATPGAA